MSSLQKQFKETGIFQKYGIKRKTFILNSRTFAN